MFWLDIYEPLTRKRSSMMCSRTAYCPLGMSPGLMSRVGERVEVQSIMGNGHMGTLPVKRQTQVKT